MNDEVRLLRAVVTPTRLVFPPSVPITTSRMSRMLASQYSLVVVAFRDENLDKIQNVEEVLTGVKEAIANGLEIMGRRFYFLCSSASQIRDHKVGKVFKRIPTGTYGTVQRKKDSMVLYWFPPDSIVLPPWYGRVRNCT